MNPQFPSPVYDGKRRRWRESAVINFDRALEGLEPIERDPADERWLNSAQIRERYGVSDMWIWRRTARIADHDGQAA